LPCCKQKRDLFYGESILEKKRAYLLVNFGGPRDLNEVEEFLIALLTDREVVRTRLPSLLHKILFTRIAKKRARRVVTDYAQIGGKSPLYEDTEALAKKVGVLLKSSVLTFHRYLPATHGACIEAIERIPKETEIRVFPLFPQFSYATTGSIAKWFTQHLGRESAQKMVWTKSYPTHAGYLSAFEGVIRASLEKHGFAEERTILLFSAHGLPQEFIRTGDVYERECALTFHHLAERFPKALSRLSYQSQWGSEEWTRPYTSDVCHSVHEWGKGYEHLLVIPLSFTSDHIETLFEIEKLYLPLLKQKLEALRCPALNQGEEWIEVIASIFRENEGVSTQKLLRCSTD
jgi:protoporphyrin/coproporphyrin ferrochelatase